MLHGGCRWPSQQYACGICAIAGAKLRQYGLKHKVLGLFFQNIRKFPAFWQTISFILLPLQFKQTPGIPWHIFCRTLFANITIKHFPRRYASKLEIGKPVKNMVKASISNTSEKIIQVLTCSSTDYLLHCSLQEISELSILSTRLLSTHL